MARPQKKKRVCRKPKFEVFAPQDIAEITTSIDLTIDEYETIRLIDLKGVSREECARRMSIARTTAQDIYNSARNKLARALVEGAELRITGGNFDLCDGNAGCPDCQREALMELENEK